MSTTRKIIVTWGMPGGTSRFHQSIEIPAEATNIRCVAELPVEVVPRPDNDIIQVLLPGRSNPYVFRCPGADVGDRVAVSPYGGAPTITRVIDLGRGRYRGAVTKVATLVDE